MDAVPYAHTMPFHTRSRIWRYKVQKINGWVAGSRGVIGGAPRTWVSKFLLSPSTSWGSDRAHLCRSLPPLGVWQSPSKYALSYVARSTPGCDSGSDLDGWVISLGPGRATGAYLRSPPPLDKLLKPHWYAGKISLHRFSNVRNPNMILFLQDVALQVKPRYVNMHAT